MILLGPIKSNVARQAIKNIDVIKYLLIIYFQMCKMLTALNLSPQIIYLCMERRLLGIKKRMTKTGRKCTHNVIRRTWFG